jgi:hypothetical protein
MQFLGNGGDDDDDDIFVYTGGEQHVPFDMKRVRIAENVDTIPASTFHNREQLREVVGHNKIKKVEQEAFSNCPSLRRVMKMQGVIEIEKYAFYFCQALSYVDFEKLEMIGYRAFDHCSFLRSINMRSVRRVEECAFCFCFALTDVVFGEKLERIEPDVFNGCYSLRRIAIPLKYGLIGDNAFVYCNDLSRVDALDGRIHKTISSLHLDSWRNEMEEEIDRINLTLPNIRANDKTQPIRQWITTVLSKMEHYKSEHKILVKEAMTLLELALWKANLRENDGAAAAQEGVRVTRGQRKRKRNDRCITSGASIVIKNVLPFLALK